MTEEAKMSAGSKGFAVAHWKDGTSTESEMTNIQLEAFQTVKKRPAAAAEPKVKKKPAGAQWREPDDADERDEEGLNSSEVLHFHCRHVVQSNAKQSARSNYSLKLTLSRERELSLSVFLCSVFDREVLRELLGIAEG